MVTNMKTPTLTRSITTFVLAIFLSACAGNHQVDQQNILNGSDLVSTAKQSITEVRVADVKDRLDEYLILDVREPDEVAQGQIANAVSIPRGLLEFRANKVIFDHAVNNSLEQADVPILTYCRSGSRGALATKTLEEMGYTNVVSLQGGYKAWQRSTSESSTE